MHEIYRFNPPIVHIDYSVVLTKALAMDNIFDSKPIIMQYLFHFIQEIYKKMKNIKIFKKKINKHSFEIIKNIELICFSTLLYKYIYKIFKKQIN